MSRPSGPDAQPATRPRDGHTPSPEGSKTPADPPAEGQVEERDPSGGPGSAGWWLDDGPDSPIAADIEEPEKHL